MEDFNIMWIHWEIHHIKNQYIQGDCLKREAWKVCRVKGEALAKKEGNALSADY